MPGRLRRAAVAAFALLSWSSVAFADLPIYTESLSQVEAASRHAEEKVNAGKPVEVDLFTGTASLTVRDVHVPGNGGLDIEVFRRYEQVRQQQTLFDCIQIHGTLCPKSTSPELAPFGRHHRGWSLTAGPVLKVMTAGHLTLHSMHPNYDRICTLQPWRDGEGRYGIVTLYSIVTPSGTQEKLVPTATGEAISRSGWRLTCSGGRSGTRYLQSPDGRRYTMDVHIISNDIESYDNIDGKSRWTFLPSRVEDVHGNSLVYGYTTLGASARNGGDLTAPFLTSIAASDGRTLALDYETADRHARITAISSNGTVLRRYRYNTFGELAEVEAAPSLAHWRYEYFPLTPYHETRGVAAYGFLSTPIPGAAHLQPEWAKSGALKRLSFPAGGAVTLDYAPSRVLSRAYAGYEAPPWPGTCLEYAIIPCESEHAAALWTLQVVTQESSDGGRWTYDYQPGDAAGELDAVTVQTPGTTELHKFIGQAWFLGTSRADGYYHGSWQMGLPVESHYGSLRSEYREWSAIVFSPVFRQSVAAWILIHDDITSLAVLTRKVVQQSGVSYGTDYARHDRFGRPTLVTESGPNGGVRTTALSYLNDLDRWIIGRPKDEMSEAGSISRVHDALGNVVSLTKDGVSTAFAYDSQGNLASKTLPRGLVHTYSAYQRGVPTLETQPEGVSISRTVDDAGNITSETNGEGHTTRFAFDTLNRVTGVIYPAGNPKTIVHTPSSRTVTRGGLVETTTFDGFGRPVAVDTAGIPVAMRYDALGRKTFQSVAGFPTVGHAFEYDGLNRLLSILHTADNSSRTFTHGAAGGVPTLAVRDERGHVTTHHYRAYGDPDKTLLMDIAAPIPAASVAIERNAHGLVTSATQAGITRTFGYDARNYLTSANHPEVGTVEYGRDDAGNMTSKRVGTAAATQYEYDGRNRLWRVTYPGGSPSQVVNTYWRTDKLRSAENAVARRMFTYDANQNLTNEALVVDGLAMEAAYRHDGNDKLESIVYPVLGHAVQFHPDVLGRPRSVSAPSGSMLSATYWPNGQLFSIAYRGGSRVKYGQDTREWPNSMIVTTGDGATPISSSFLHDVAGNVHTIVDSVDASYNRKLSYDALNRVSTVNGPWGNGQVQYDGAGNVTAHILGNDTAGYEYDASNRLAAVTRTGSRAGRTEYHYDSLGNASPHGPGHYAYDNAGNLTRGCAGCQFAYDGTQTRVKTTLADGTATYEFRSTNGLLLAQWRKRPGHYDTLKEHIHLAGKEVAEQRTHFLGDDIKPVTWMFLQPDPAGSPVSATWTGGGLLFKESYQPHGSPIANTAAPYTRRSFAGTTQDAPDLMHMGARYYDPQIGRFLSVDPKEADPSDLHSLNRYAYANNNPYRYVDPDGHSPLDLGFFVVDAVKLGMALTTGTGAGEAAVDFAMSAAGLLSPVPGTGLALKAARAADNMVDAAKGADRALDAVSKVDDAARGSGLIYRAASGTPASMTPRAVDGKGLSAADSLTNALPGKNQVIDTSKFKNLCATCDNRATGHVSITPTDMGQMQDWINSRGSSEVHPLTQELMNSVVDTVRK
jgi:RHS repeat-associated protein